MDELHSFELWTNLGTRQMVSLQLNLLDTKNRTTGYTYLKATLIHRAHRERKACYQLQQLLDYYGEQVHPGKVRIVATYPTGNQICEDHSRLSSHSNRRKQRYDSPICRKNALRVALVVPVAQSHSRVSSVWNYFRRFAFTDTVHSQDQVCFELVVLKNQMLHWATTISVGGGRSGDDPTRKTDRRPRSVKPIDLSNLYRTAQ